MEQLGFLPGGLSKLGKSCMGRYGLIGSTGLNNVDKLYCCLMYQVMFLHKVDVMKRSLLDPAVFNLLHVKQSEMTGFKLKATNPSDR